MFHSKSIPDYAIASGNPAPVTGSVLEIDEKYFHDEVVQKNYFRNSSGIQGTQPMESDSIDN